MREIKFRAWDKEEEMMLNDVSLQNETWDMMNELFRNEDSLSFMQYTGLKDKNGVEIYEGDIVECFNDGLSEVLFRKGSFGTLTYTSRGVDFYTFNEVYGACEIIGNICENPELLEREPQ